MENVLFRDLPLSDEIQRALDDMGFETATEIQSLTIPKMLEGIDLIGKSHTGTGKTIAFGIPAVMQIEGRGTQALVLCPTRELAMQAEGELRKLCKYYKNIRTLAVYGGEPITNQLRQMRRAPEIVVGTPGRIMDHLRRHTLKLDNLKLLVLDEADEMLNMGFREDIETILESVPDERQTVLFSATMPPEIMEITSQYQKDPLLMEAGSTEERTINTVRQFYFEVPRGAKADALVLLLHTHQPHLSIIFCNTKKMADELGRVLSEHGFNASVLHGDMKQEMRTSVMNSFKSGRTPILIATDVAARGIDVDDVDAVYNFDIPQDYEYYIHRIGRTGRAGKSGVSYTLADGRRQVMQIRDIERFIGAKITRRDLPDFNAIASQRRQALTDAVRATLLERINGCENGLVSAVPVLQTLYSEGFSAEDIAETALAHLLSREMENIPEVRAPKPVQPKPLVPLGEGNVRLRVSVGRNQKVAPNHIVAAITDATGISGKRIGKIQCYGEYSLVEVPAEAAKEIIRKTSGTPIGGFNVDIRLYTERGKQNASSSRSSRSGSDRKTKFGHSSKPHARLHRKQR